MNKLIAEFKNALIDEKMNELYECNYADNYYGDQVCQPKSANE